MNSNTPKSELKQAAAEWAEFLYAEYLRDNRQKKLLKIEQDKKIIKPTYHDKPKA